MEQDKNMLRIEKVLIWTARLVAAFYTVFWLVVFVGEGFAKLINNMSLLMHWWPLILSLVIAVIANLKMFKKPLLSSKLFLLALLLLLVYFMLIGNLKNYFVALALIAPYLFVAVIIYLFSKK